MSVLSVKSEISVESVKSVMIEKMYKSVKKKVSKVQ